MSSADVRKVAPDLLFSNARFSVDDTVLYLTLIRSVLERCRTVVDVGCGRGGYADTDVAFESFYDFRGPGRDVIGLDIDHDAQSNPYIDEFRLISDIERWPMDADSTDLVVSDFTLEHVADPASFVANIARVLRPGGLLVARTVSYYSFLASISRLVPNSSHKRVVSRLQPARSSVDVFPAFYRMNTRRTLSRYLSGGFEFSVAYRPALENYVPPRLKAMRPLIAAAERRLPEPMQSALVVCARLNIA